MMKGVMLAAYGTPSTMDDIERFYTDIRRGVKPSREQLEGLKARYAA
ncbi:MAG: ferrochelatase, partial [Candidatus Marsarchaeota archaeon]|nr:ferrochelatase [Candidatus Marsarchaeota archaeon]